MKYIPNLIFFILYCTYSFGQQSIDGNFAFQNNPAKKYSLYIPSSYNAQVPNDAMLALHPLNTNRWDSQSWRDTLIAFAEENNLILIAPDGGIDGRIDDPIDTAFTSALIDSTMKWYNIDEQQVFVMGFSWGGKTTYTYGLRRINQFAGFMIINPAVNLSEVNGIIENANNKAFYLIHGSNDSPGVRYFPFVDALNANNACLETEYMQGIGHTIDFPNRNQILSNAFSFLKANNCSTTSTSNSFISNLNVYPNPSKGRIFFDKSIENSSIKIFSSNGQALAFHKAENYIEISCDPQMVFLYIVDGQSIDVKKILIH
ncbi:MAG: hypothetical protein AAGK97_01775 [Bacteroidota bacterium]